MKKWFLSVLLALGMVLLTSCSSSNTIDIKNIKFKASTVLDGNWTRVMLDVTNNTKYDIIELHYQFHQRDDVTDENLSVLSDNDDFMFFYSEWDLHDIWISCDIESQIGKGKTVSENCYFTSGYIYVTDMKQFELMEPTMVGIKYTDGNEIYSVTYDYLNNSYSSVKTE